METINGNIINSPNPTSLEPVPTKEGERGLRGEADEEGLSLIDMINSLKEFYAELKKKWLIVTIIVCISSLIGLLFPLDSEPKYIAVSTLMLENSKGGNTSGVFALASQFGLTSGGSSAVINEDKLIEIIKAETIIKSTLFKKVTIDSKTDLLANHFIDLLGYRKTWQEEDSLKDFRFINFKENMTLGENTVFKMFYGQIVGSFLKIDKSKSGIITITTTTQSELFSKYFNEYLVKAVSSFYVDRIIEKGQINLDIVQKRVDSIAIALKDAEFALARWKDANFQLVKAQGMIAEIQLRRNVEVCNSIYIEGIKQLEISKFTSLQQTPFLQIIDQPTFPLVIKRKISPIRAMIIGFIFGCIVAGLYVFARKKYAELMIEMVQKQN